MTIASIVVPTFNEAGNVKELIRRITEAVEPGSAEIIFVDDSRDDTPAVIERERITSTLPVRLIHRKEATGGLGGAVLEGIRAAEHDWVIVMDGDLQHPPEMIPVLLATASTEKTDLVVASRYAAKGGAGGLSNGLRHLVSRASTILTRSMFPSRLRDCTDPMTGFFAVRRSTVPTELLRPRGFKILLEIIARSEKRLSIAEEPFLFAKRFDGESKASFRQGIHFFLQLLALRFGRMSGFALIGALGAIANLGIMAALTGTGVNYLIAALIAAEITIIGNFALQERFVFRDLRAHAGRFWRRFLLSFTFNNVDALLRLPALYLLVSVLGLNSVLATAITLVIAFLIRFAFHSRVVYAPRPTRGAPVSVAPPQSRRTRRGTPLR